MLADVAVEGGDRDPAVGRGQAPGHGQAGVGRGVDHDPQAPRHAFGVEGGGHPPGQLGQGGLVAVGGGDDGHVGRHPPRRRPSSGPARRPGRPWPPIRAGSGRGSGRTPTTARPTTAPDGRRPRSPPGARVTRSTSATSSSLATWRPVPTLSTWPGGRWSAPATRTHASTTSSTYTQSRRRPGPVSGRVRAVAGGGQGPRHQPAGVVVGPVDLERPHHRRPQAPPVGGGHRQQRAGGLGRAEEAAGPQRRVLVHGPVGLAVLGGRSQPHDGLAVVGEGVHQPHPARPVDGGGGGPFRAASPRPGTRPAGRRRRASATCPAAIGRGGRVGQVGLDHVDRIRRHPQRGQPPRPCSPGRTMPVTSQPSATSRAARWAPTNPPTPVTSAFTPPRPRTGRRRPLPAGAGRRRPVGVRAVGLGDHGQDPGDLDVEVAAGGVGVERAPEEGERRRQAGQLAGQQAAGHRVPALGDGEAGHAERDAGGGGQIGQAVHRAVDEGGEQGAAAAVDHEVVHADVDPGQGPCAGARRPGARRRSSRRGCPGRTARPRAPPPRRPPPAAAPSGSSTSSAPRATARSISAGVHRSHPLTRHTSRPPVAARTAARSSGVSALIWVSAPAWRRRLPRRSQSTTIARRPRAAPAGGPNPDQW